MIEENIAHAKCLLATSNREGFDVPRLRLGAGFFSHVQYSILESVKYNLWVYSTEKIGAMQFKKCLLIAAFLFLLTGFLASFQPTKVLPSVSASGVYPAPPIEWTGVCAGRSVQQTSDGGFVTFGSGLQQALVIRSNFEGEQLWNRSFGILGYEVQCYSGQQTSDEGYILIGGAKGVSANYGDAWLSKCNETGDMLWNKTYGGEGHEYAFSGQQTPDGGYVLAGVADPLGINNDDFYLLKTDSYGSMEWNKTYGGSSSEIAWSVHQTFDGGYILAGEAYSSGRGLDCWLVKADADGGMEWNKTYGTDYLFSVESNSTITSMGFDANSQTLSFTATGAGGTKGYVKATAAKSLVLSLKLLKVHVDGVEQDYDAWEADNSWVLLFEYEHSSHLIEIQLDYTVPEFTSVLLTLFMAATLFAAIAYRRKSALV